MVNFGDFTACNQTVLPDMSILKGQKLMGTAKIEKFYLKILGNFQTEKTFKRKLMKNTKIEKFNWEIFDWFFWNLHMTFRLKILDWVSPSILEATQEYFPPCLRVTPCNTKLEPDIMIPLLLSCKTITSCKVKQKSYQNSYFFNSIGFLRYVAKQLCKPLD